MRKWSEWWRIEEGEVGVEARKNISSSMQQNVVEIWKERTSPRKEREVGLSVWLCWVSRLHGVCVCFAHHCCRHGVRRNVPEGFWICFGEVVKKSEGMCREF
ncbi:unnamed protein product [Camellia sinensis]